MLRSVLLSFAFISFLCAKPMAKASPPRRFLPQQTAVIPVREDDPLVHFYERVRYADALCAKETIVFEKKIVKGRARLLERPVLLAALDPRDGSWHMIHLAVPNPIPDSYIKSIRKAKTIAEREACTIPVRVLTPGYDVVHVAGVGPTRFTVRVTYARDGNPLHRDPLVVYRMVWVRIPGRKETDFARATQRAQLLYYTPTTKELITPKLINEGKNFLLRKMAVAKNHLRELGVRSKAFPERRLADVFPDEIVLSLMISEQWDPLYFSEDRAGSMSRILAEYGINREEAFMWSVSSANAIGALQFTNKHNNGTYASVVRGYRDARLEKSFEDGARNMHNIIKAAICLLDLELARSQKACDLFAKDATLGGIQPVAAYNGGPVAGERMVGEIERLNGKKLSLLDRAIMKLPNFILPASYRSVQNRKNKLALKGIRVNSETPMYIKKYLFLMEYWEKKKR